MSEIGESIEAARKKLNRERTENWVIQVECDKRERELAQAARKIELMKERMKGMKK